MKPNYSEIYYHTLNLIGSYGKKNPELMTAFSKLHQIASKNGNINAKNKELIALGISIHAKCEGCIVMHIHDAIENGATENDIIETIGVATYMGGGPSVVHGAKAYSAWQDFVANKAL